MTKKTLEKISDKQRFMIYTYRNRYTSAKRECDSKTIDLVRVSASAYLHGLMDAEAITDRERMILFCYITV